MRTHLLACLAIVALGVTGAPGASAHGHHRGHHACGLESPAGGQDGPCRDCAQIQGHGCGCVDCACEDGGRIPPAASGSAPSSYDRDTVTTIRGSVTSVAMVPARGGRTGGWHATLDSEGRQTDVHLGPSWFLDKLGLGLAKGEAIEVTGSLVEQANAPVLIAREVKWAGRAFTLRDERGVPAWSGGVR